MVRGEDADAAMQVLSGFELHGSTITVSMARRGRARTPTPGTYHGPPKRERMDRRGGDRFDPRFDPRGPPRGYRDLPVRDPRPSPYERYEKYDRYDKYYGYGRSRYEERPVARNYRVNYGAERPEFEERPMYDRSYERRPSSRYEERYDRY
ncbi:hypothetical protein BGW38_005139 [Lunasporangiospora selenospora]|uniref:RRM domain-containing protein n=1 Tax=Lunasporangiospora selenospora TaxID=979761 RepID=A0A9P6KBK1_9FUNG|nr:hypothetical protein BGW38_005139 [Lunasporangiospora selenospora]